MNAPVKTVRQLESFIAGDWVRGAGKAVPLLDAATGAEVALIDASGLDMKRALNHGREAGGPALRKMSFHERALMLKALGQALMEAKEEFYTLSTATGATRTDSWIDIEGGVGTLLSYASKGRRELPNTRTLVDGDVEALSRDNTFSGQHILTPLEGVAIHINAFNFPCWGMLEKLAPTLLAGMPAIVKPASQTAYLTELMVRKIIATGILPKGALQLISGSVGDLLDHVDCQDVVTFTGSAATGRKLKTHPAIVENSVRFTMEADSLNAAILGPDAVAGTEEFDLFVKEIAREMTVKAGQKCTAIRRVIAPRATVEPLIKALGDRLAKTVLGNPGEEATRMGPLASLAQRDEVRARIAELQGDAEIVAGDPAQANLMSGDAQTGAFLSPVLLYCDKPGSAKAVHDVEAFGPVSTIIPYETAEEAAELARRGKGSLVASVFTNDAAFAREAVEALGPWHGRVMLGNRVSAKSSTGHGSPLPVLVHGGPGRAGGGEELGGMRSVKHYMQRTAVQGAPWLLSEVTGRWMQGAKTRQDGIHPFRKSLAELEIGDQLVTASRTVTLEDIEHFAHFTGDTFYAHMDEEAAKANPFFDGRVAHGYLIVSFAAGLFVDPAPGPVLANYGVDALRFLTPVNPGDSLQVTLTCKQINPRETEDYGEVRWDCTVTNQDAQLVAQYDVLTMVAKTWPA
ncbi:fused aldehyde dehydrogenase; enoyl-CoA hydratase [Bosea sp. 62]|uniref:phenylacetic acid degradation bifunctional protein PaaZ n=1 Tax=unclassified Bosea (in: a-proteobacteria) TaxID=2653178 RepID=UPI001252B22C|nr:MULTISPECIES: phenylacetic acid degradation bifunctional protein PaaZ [unclassified Bosea (in: a-proteobacteria)]CAD5253903.1 fused aldehyde dehydrogenase; enoyl-CoA hydratase [Bosea sp. 46]CAD5258730.1 fused aldehyde dehydrogenase; enoyl-CoA hydratase [Bosea sp. 21B]CAD5282155.1 fused aldehyde dehydrogenase; enoyl-CoA hydratase [Bosea sp. 7B]VVT51834.1 fused aldehyde dehydrogenase; enoyl-CoA hydratase [Bosea sp. EC-HK365B]VXB42347.1 fused aldehyde dehydrogenase; enoyl-CoA hydratase [Bosea 